MLTWSTDAYMRQKGRLVKDENPTNKSACGLSELSLIIVTNDLFAKRV